MLQHALGLGTSPCTAARGRRCSLLVCPSHVIFTASSYFFSLVLHREPPPPHSTSFPPRRPYSLSLTPPAPVSFSSFCRWCQPPTRGVIQTEHATLKTKLNKQRHTMEVAREEESARERANMRAMAEVRRAGGGDGQMFNEHERRRGVLRRRTGCWLAGSCGNSYRRL